MSTIITLTIKEPKGQGRPIVISAAPEGEMPIIRTGLFQDRHQLLDDIWAELLTRKPKLVKVADKKSQPAGKSQDGAPEAEAEAPEAEADPISETANETLAEDQAAEPDQLVRPETLPAIEGDAE